MNTEQIASRLVSWIKGQVSSAGYKGAVLGMSGGLDSSVAAVLCIRAFPDNTLGVIMPCYSSPEDKEHATMVSEKFSIPIKTVILDSVADSLIGAVYPNEQKPDISQLAEANIKVRLRMVTLYHFANQLGYMVVGSSNKSELYTGYFTKYGDGGIDIMPLGSLVKRQIRELAGFLGIPQPIIDKPPSAGLWPGQTDETQLGITYEELDSYLLGGAGPHELKEKIEAMNRTCSHKRIPPPIADIH